MEPQDGMITCPNCGGTSQDCKICQGKKVIPALEPFTCPECQGQDKNCRLCKGKGRVFPCGQCQGRGYNLFDDSDDKHCCHCEGKRYLPEGTPPKL